MPSATVRWLCLSLLVVTHASAQTLSDEFSIAADRLNRAVWTTEIGNGSFLGRTQLRDWVTEDGVGRFTVVDGAARLVLETFNPTGFSLYGTHAKTRASFQPTAQTDIVLEARLRLTSLQPGVVYGLYFYGCGASCASDHDEVDIELVSNFLQDGAVPARVQLNRYAAEPLGAGHGVIVDLPTGFDRFAYHAWKIRWSLSQLDYFVDNVRLFSATTVVPQRPMHADMIAWGPASDWSAAFDPNLQPTSQSSSNQSFVALIDRFEVRTVPRFADSPLTPESTVIRLAHIVELRTHIGNVRGRAGLPVFQWTDPDLRAGVTTVKAQHVVDLRTALAEAYVALGLLPPVYLGAVTEGAAVRASHLEEVRAAVIGVE